MMLQTVILVVCAISLAYSELINGRFPYYILEELASGTRIGNVAIDAQLNKKYDTLVFRQLNFTFLNSDIDLNVGLFHIDPSSSIISTTRKIDRDVLCGASINCYVPIDVAVGPATYFEILKIIIEIIDINDNQPRFDKDGYQIPLRMDTPIGTSLTLPLAEDRDSRPYAVVSNNLAPMHNPFFRIELDRDQDQSITDVQLITERKLLTDVNIYQLRMTAVDGGHPRRNGSTYLNIRVQLEGVTSQSVQKQYLVFVAENEPTNSIIAKVSIDNESLSEIFTYMFTPSTIQQFGKHFGINEHTGEIKLSSTVDFETQSEYALNISASSHSGQQLSMISVRVLITDINDWQPSIVLPAEVNSTGMDVLESTPVDSLVTSFTVLDHDGGQNGQVACYINDPTFKLQESGRGEFEITLRLSINREAREIYNLEIRCSDMGDPPHSTSEMLEIRIVDATDNKPRFERPIYEAHILENNPVGVDILTVYASDQDLSDNARILYAIDPNYEDMFEIGQNTGTIKTKTELNREIVSDVTFTVFAFDMGVARQTGSTMIHVYVDDVNDSPPTFLEDSIAVGVFENERPGTLAGQVEATDADGSPYNSFHYALDTSNKSVPFEIDNDSGEITTTRYLDREAQSVYYFMVLAIADTEPIVVATASVTVYVADRNDNKPIFQWPSGYEDSIHIARNTPLDTIIATLHATDQDVGDNAKLQYAVDTGKYSDYFKVHLSTGEISVAKPLLGIDEGTVALRVAVSDWGPVSFRSTSVIYIVLNHTLSCVNTDSKTIQDCGTKVIVVNNNKMIIVALTSVGLLLLFTIVLSVVLIKKTLLARSNDCDYSTCDPDGGLSFSKQNGGICSDA